MTAQLLARLITELLDDLEESNLDAATPSSNPPLQILPMVSSTNRAFIGAVSGSKSFIITVVEV